MKIQSSDNLAHQFPVSIKGALFIEGKIPLLKNERDEFELPGGKLEPGELPEICLAREIKEELDINVNVDKIIDSWLYEIDDQTQVVIITYACSCSATLKDLQISNEHKELKTFFFEEINSIKMPTGYKASIHKLFKA